jgi:hypothetical protein
VTVDPLAPVPVAPDALVRWVVRRRTGRLLKAEVLLSRLRRYDALLRARARIREDVDDRRPRYACPACGRDLVLASSRLKQVFFRHRVEGVACPLSAAGATEEQIRAWKYQGAREGAAHLRLKGLLLRGLRADPAFSGVAAESTWKSGVDPAAWRRPDVRARLGGLAVAFEAQLTTTFLSVVLERRRFYRGEGALLVWVLAGFDPDRRPMTVDDILAGGDWNLLVVDDETTAVSEATRRFHVRAHWRVPVLDGLDRRDAWASRVTPFQDLLIDTRRQLCRAFDFEAADRAADAELARRRAYAERDAAARAAELAAAAEARRRADAEALRADVLAFWRSWNPYQSVEEAERTDLGWEALCERLAEVGVPPVRGVEADRLLRTAVLAVASAFEGRPVGFGYAKLIQVAHHLYDSHPRALMAFGHALREAGRGDLLDEQDRTGKWRERRSRIRTVTRVDPTIYDAPPDVRAVLAFLFPAIARRLWAAAGD